MNGSIFIRRLTCAYWFPRLRAYGSDLGWDLIFELGLSVVMVLGAPFRYPIGYSIDTLLVLALGNQFETWEESLVGVLIATLAGLMIGNGEGSLVGLSL